MMRFSVLLRQFRQPRGLDPELGELSRYTARSCVQGLVGQSSVIQFRRRRKGRTTAWRLNKAIIEDCCTMSSVARRSDMPRENDSVMQAFLSAGTNNNWFCPVWFRRRCQSKLAETVN